MALNDTGVKDHVYSPDLKNVELGGTTGAFNTVASFLVGPIRLLLRVVHNIFILPADLMLDYANGLIFVSIVVGAVGVFDYFVYNKWPLLLSQIISLAVALILKKKAQSGVEAAQEKREVKLDTAQVEEFCNTIYAELNDIIGKDLD